MCNAIPLFDPSLSLPHAKSLALALPLSPLGPHPAFRMYDEASSQKTMHLCCKPIPPPCASFDMPS
jgi:hypothetical protein